MNGRERVIACLSFGGPDRAPRDLWALPAVQLFQMSEYRKVVEEYPLDIEGMQISPGGTEKTVQATASAGTYLDDWGSLWAVGEPGVIGEVKVPAIADWSALEGYRLPWHLIQDRDPSRVDSFCETSTRFTLSECTARPFERLQFLCGSQRTFLEIAYQTPELIRLLKMLHEFYLEDIRWWCGTRVDGILLMDDWGMNQSLLISPDIWRTLFKPLYREYCDLIHGAGKYAFFHCDGNIESIFGDLIDVGMDAINSQLFCMNIEKLGRNYRGKVTFWGEIDRQHILPFGTRQDVLDAVARVRNALDDGRGGVIAQCEWGKGVPQDRIEAVYKAWSLPRGICCD